MFLKTIFSNSSSPIRDKQLKSLEEIHFPDLEPSLVLIADTDSNSVKLLDLESSQLIAP